MLKRIGQSNERREVVSWKRAERVDSSEHRDSSDVFERRNKEKIRDLRNFG